jgi:hypothetical protein
MSRPPTGAEQAPAHHGDAVAPLQRLGERDPLHGHGRDPVERLDHPRVARHDLDVSAVRKFLEGAGEHRLVARVAVAEVADDQDPSGAGRGGLAVRVGGVPPAEVGELLADQVGAVVRHRAPQAGGYTQ